MWRLLSVILFWGGYLGIYDNECISRVGLVGVERRA